MKIAALTGLLLSLILSNRNALAGEAVNVVSTPQRYVFELPKSAEKRLIDYLSSGKIVDVSEVIFSARNYAEYLGVSISVAKDGGFEGAGHFQLILRKTVKDRDWAKAEILRAEQPLGKLFEMSDVDFRKFLIPVR